MKLHKITLSLRAFPLFFLSTFFCAAMNQYQHQQNDVVTSSSDINLAALLENEFTLNSSEKIGAFLKDNAAYLSMPIGALASIQLALICHKNKLLGNRGDINFFVGGILGGTASAFTSYKLFKLIGNRLLPNQRTLAYLVAQWPSHKRDIPEEFHSFLHALHELKKVHDTQG